MSAPHDFIAVVMLLKAMTNAEADGLPELWHEQIGLSSMVSRANMLDKPPARGTENWTKRDHDDIRRMRIHEDLLRPVREWQTYRELRAPQLLIAPDGGRWWWKVQL